MPQRVTIQKFNSLTGRFWVNRYLTTALVSAGGATIDGLVAAERAILRSESIITSARIDDNVEETDNYDTVSVNLNGQLTGEGETSMPLFVVARVDFDVAGGGRPSRKYLRHVLTEASSGLTSIAPTIITALNNYAAAVVAVGTICDPQGNLFVDGVVWPYPQMRQLKRASKKKIIPS
jgi:hypothetical protein